MTRTSVAGFEQAHTGARLPRLGQGTWQMGEDPARRDDEADALRLGLDLGMTLIDTAEMYAGGGAEQVVGDAIAGRRDEVYLVSKVLPENASRRGTVEACERSLRHLGTDRLDLYLLHWPGRHPLEETLAAMEQLREAGKIVDHGISNFDAREQAAACALPGGERIAANQVLYNLGRRAVEDRLLPDCRERGIVVMAYSPLEQGRLRAGRPALTEVAARHGATPEQVALAWTLRDPGVVTIVKSAHPVHVRFNVVATDLVGDLTETDLAALDRDFPPPAPGARLETL